MENATSTTSNAAELPLPELSVLLEGLAAVLRIFVMVGPLVLLGLGLCYFLLPTKEANYSVGYRFLYGMSRIPVWQFMQKLAGIVFSGLGLVLTVVMALLCLGLETMDTMEALNKCITLLFWEIGLTLAAVAAINITVVARYDIKGVLRREKKSEEE